jgi:HD-GYP domain-containing protein (c-di-GMP phosphodiesterase class II)
MEVVHSTVEGMRAMVTSRKEQFSLMQRNWCVTISSDIELAEIDEREGFTWLSPTFPTTTKRSAFDDSLFLLVCQEAASTLLPEEKSESSSLKHQFLEDISILSLRLQIKDRELYRHSLRVLDITRRFLKTLHIPQEVSIIIQIAAFFHDAGKIDISHDILQKPSALTPGEFEEVKKHSTHGERRLSQIGPLQEASRMVYHHHEHWDGHGYPDGLQGQAIPLGSRIITIADSFTVMTTGRPYKRPRSPFHALAELSRCAGTQFDPLLVDHFCRNLGTSLLEEETSRATTASDYQATPFASPIISAPTG